ncbi:S-layer homology domain-containing protein [Paenibacillus mendelii]|uniref:S-layer homology domain-containing protein n=1 Tax=Paenibacillus mendelii TaxID=206163 RepID=A0ABV6JH59_9BACL
MTSGVMVGSDGKFRPNAKVTRAEAVTILHRVYTDIVNN